MNIASQLENEIQNAHSQHQSELERIRELEMQAQQSLQTSIDDSFELVFEELMPMINERVMLYEESKANQVDGDELRKAKEFVRDLETKRYKKAMKTKGPVREMLLKEKNRALELIQKAQMQKKLPSDLLVIPIRLNQYENGQGTNVEISYPVSSDINQGLLGSINQSVISLKDECERLNSASHQRYELKDATADELQETLLSKLTENKDLNKLFRFRVFVTGSSTSTSQSPEPGAAITEPAEPGEEVEAAAEPETIYTISTRQLAERVGEDYAQLSQFLSKDSALKGMRQKRGVTNFYSEEAVEHVRKTYSGRLDSMKPVKRPETQKADPKEVKISAKRARIERNKKIKQMAVSGIGPKDIAEEIGLTRGTVENVLKDMGIFSWRYVQQHYSSVDKIRNADIPGANCFNDPEKQNTRNNLNMMIVQYIKKPIRYLGLEGGNLASYIDLCRNSKVLKRQSMIVERNAKTYQVMKSFQKHRKMISGGEIFGGISMREGRLSDTVARTSGSYNVINLDYMGVLNDEKIRTLVTLFDQGQIDETAILAITLNNNELSLK
jgi:hypothetical protein